MNLVKIGDKYFNLDYLISAEWMNGSFTLRFVGEFELTGVKRKTLENLLKNFDVKEVSDLDENTGKAAPKSKKKILHNEGSMEKYIENTE